jgi:hypothetical protein
MVTATSVTRHAWRTVLAEFHENWPTIVESHTLWRKQFSQAVE